MSRSVDSHEFWVGAGRPTGGAILFSLPLLMTLEMWHLAFCMPRLRLALLVGLARFIGFKDDKTDVRDSRGCLSVPVVDFRPVRGSAPRPHRRTVDVLGFPAAVGAAAARLII